MAFTLFCHFEEAASQLFKAAGRREIPIVMVELQRGQAANPPRTNLGL